MIRGFTIKTESGTNFGVCNYASDVPDSVIIDDLVAETDADPDCIELCCAHDLIDSQYGGIVFLTSEA